jgi:spore maturation protein SpmB
MIWMLVILIVLFWTLEFLKQTGALDLSMKAIAPVLRLAGIKGEAGHLTAIGLFLGISYGAGFLIREAQSGSVPPRQIFLSCVLMGFAHSLIEDSLLVIALGSDAITIVLGRFIFAMLATALIALLLKRVPDDVFYAVLFQCPKSDKGDLDAAAGR